MKKYVVHFPPPSFPPPPPAPPPPSTLLLCFFLLIPLLHRHHPLEYSVHGMVMAFECSDSARLAFESQTIDMQCSDIDLIVRRGVWVHVCSTAAGPAPRYAVQR